MSGLVGARLTVKTSELVLPDGQVPDIGAMSGGANVVFAMKPGEISGPVNLGGSGAVLAVIEKQDPTEADFAAKKDQVRDGLIQTRENELFGMFVNNLRQQMEKAGKMMWKEMVKPNWILASSSASVCCRSSKLA